jgi:hypothetical protein
MRGKDAAGPLERHKGIDIAWLLSYDFVEWRSSTRYERYFVELCWLALDLGLFHSWLRGPHGAKRGKR